MKINIKKLLIIFIIAIFLISIFSNVYALSGADITGNFTGTTDFEGRAKIGKLVGGILDAVRIATAGVAIIMLTVLGAKYMLSSPNDRAEIKKSATLYVVGAIVMMGASFLVTIIRDFATTNIKDA